MKRLTIFACIISVSVFFATGYLYAYDPPHSSLWTTDSTKQIGCSGGCHGGSGVSLTSQSSNSTLCTNCHAGGQPGQNFTLADSEQAWWVTANGTSGKWWDSTSGSSHRWDRKMDAGTSPLWLTAGNSNNIFGLRTYGDLPSSPVKTVYEKYGNVVVCSACHNQHYQTEAPWDGDSNADSGTASGGTGTDTLLDSTKTTWTTGQWNDGYVRIISGACRGNVKQIKTSGTNAITIYATQVLTDSYAKRTAFATGIASGSKYRVMGSNDFLRMQARWSTTGTELCIFCHYYRRANVSSDPKSQRFQAWDGNKRSHPINIRFSSAQGETPTSDSGRPGWTSFFSPAPLEPVSVFNGSTVARQASSSIYPYRYALNGGWDTNPTNNLMLDPNGNMMCMSCHGMHYRDSDSSTVDQSQ